jgi:NADPH2:quinone reductase
VIGFAAGDIPAVPFNLMLLKQCQVVGVNWGAWAGANPQQNGVLFDELLSLYGEGRIDPRPPQSWPLEQAGAALRALMDRKVIGKGALTMRD